MQSQLPDQISLDRLHEFVGQTFIVIGSVDLATGHLTPASLPEREAATGKTSIELELTDADRLDPADQADSWSLLFAGPGDVSLPSATWRLRSQSCGSVVDVFLTQLASQQPEQRRYETVLMLG